MGMKFKVHTDGFNELREAVTKAAPRAEHVVALQAERDTQTFVPSLTNSMTLRTRVAGNTIIYPGPYARFLYHGKVMVDPNTGSTYAPKGGTKVVTDKNLVFSQAVHPQAQDHWFEASKAQNLEKWLRVGGKAVSNFGDD